jgi:hypothetical protein
MVLARSTVTPASLAAILQNACPYLVVVHLDILAGMLPPQLVFIDLGVDLDPPLWQFVLQEGATDTETKAAFNLSLPIKL